MTGWMLGAVAIASLVTTATAGGAAAADIEISDPWARASVGTARPGVACMRIENRSEEPAVLTGVATAVAERPELHHTVVRDGQVRMRPVEDLKISAGGSAALAPGGLHVMLVGLKRELDEGDSFQLTLRFADGDAYSVTVPVVSIGARGPGDADKGQ